MACGLKEMRWREWELCGISASGRIEWLHPTARTAAPECLLSCPALLASRCRKWRVTLIVSPCLSLTFACSALLAALPAGGGGRPLDCVPLGRARH